MSELLSRCSSEELAEWGAFFKIEKSDRDLASQHPVIAGASFR